MGLFCSVNIHLELFRNIFELTMLYAFFDGQEITLSTDVQNYLPLRNFLLISEHMLKGQQDILQLYHLVI